MHSYLKTEVEISCWCLQLNTSNSETEVGTWRSAWSQHGQLKNWDWDIIMVPCNSIQIFLTEVGSWRSAWLHMDNSRTETEILYWCLATQYKYSKLKYCLSDQRIRWRYSSKTSKTEATHWDPLMNFWWILAKIGESREARTFAHDEWPNLRLWISCSAHNPIPPIPLKGGSLDADNSEAYNASTMTKCSIVISKHLKLSIILHELPNALIRLYRALQWDWLASHASQIPFLAECRRHEANHKIWQCPDRSPSDNPTPSGRRPAIAQWHGRFSYSWQYIDFHLLPFAIKQGPHEKSQWFLKRYV